MAQGSGASGKASKGKFTFEAENSRYKYHYDPGKLSGPPEDCYPAEFELQDYVDGGIRIYCDGKPAIDLYTPMDELGEIDEDYAYGSERIYKDVVGDICDTLNDVAEAIESKGSFDENDDDFLFEDVDSWEDLLSESDFGGWEIEILPGMPDFEDFTSKRNQ